MTRTNAQGGISPRQEAAIVALLNEPNVSRAAASINLGERTLHRWLRDADFKRAYREFRRETYSQAMALTQRYAPLAVNALAKIIMDPKSALPSKVAAAAVILKFGRESLELDDLAGRIEALESAAPGTAQNTEGDKP